MYWSQTHRLQHAKFLIRPAKGRLCWMLISRLFAATVKRFQRPNTELLSVKVLGRAMLRLESVYAIIKCADNLPHCHGLVFQLSSFQSNYSWSSVSFTKLDLFCINASASRKSPYDTEFHTVQRPEASKQSSRHDWPDSGFKTWHSSLI